MQLQGLMLMLFMLVIIPIMVIFSDHDIFFIIMSLILAVSSIKNIHSILFNAGHSIPEEDEELADDLEDMINVDVKKFGTGIKVAKNLLIILFFIYSFFYIGSFYLKLTTSLVILYKVYEIVNTITLSNSNPIKSKSKVRDLIAVFANLGSVALIVFAACNKFIKMVF